MLKRLIIHADDLGADHERNAGIFEAIEAGVVTAASLLANGPAFHDAAKTIASSGFDHVSFGVHLNLTAGEPVSSGLKRMTGPDGCFCGKGQGQGLMMQRGDERLAAEIGQETAAQISRIRKAGIRIDHLDGHHHIHVFPAVIDVVIRAALDVGIHWMRRPEERSFPGSVNVGDAGLVAEAEHFNRLAEAARPAISAAALSTADHFRGLYLKGRLTLEHLEEILKTLPPGLAELMVHPGKSPQTKPSGPFSSFSHEDREAELDVLKDRALPRLLTRYGVQLSRFPEVDS